jgi:hypothetical protein
MKAEQAKEVNSKLNDKNHRIKNKAGKMKNLKKEVDMIWGLLEHQYNITLVTKLEDELA